MMMAYTFVGYLSPEESWLKVYRFDPCNGVGKPVIALQSCIFIDGKCASRAINMEKFMFGLFEVVEQCETSKRYNYATVIRRVETCLDVGIPDTIPTEIQFVNRMFYGILLDYNKNTEMYLLGLGSLLCQLPRVNFKNFPYVTPELLSTTIVCVTIQTGTVYDKTANKIFINNIDVKCFKALTFWEDKYADFSGQEHLKNLDTRLVPTYTSVHGQQWLQPLVPVYFENPSFQRPFPAIPFPKLVTPWFIPQSWRRCQSMLPAFSPSLVYPQSLPPISFPSPVSYSYPLPLKYDMSVKTPPYSQNQHFIRPLVPKQQVRLKQKVPLSSNLENQNSSCQSAENQPTQYTHTQPQTFEQTSTRNISPDPFPPSHEYFKSLAPAYEGQPIQSATSSLSLPSDISSCPFSKSRQNVCSPSAKSEDTYMTSDKTSSFNESNFNPRDQFPQSEMRAHIRALTHEVPSINGFHHDVGSPPTKSEDDTCSSISHVSTSHSPPESGQYDHTPFLFPNLAENELDTEPLLSSLERLLLRDTPSPNIFSPCSHLQDCTDIQPLSSQTTSMEGTSLQLSPVKCISPCPSPCPFLVQSCFEETASTNACQQLSQSSPASPILASSFAQQQAAQCLMRGLEFPAFKDVNTSFSFPVPVPSTLVCQDQQCSLCSSVPLSASAVLNPERAVTPPNTILPCSYPQVQPESQTAPNVQSSQISSQSVTLTSPQSEDACCNCEACSALSGDVSTALETCKSNDLSWETISSSPLSASLQDCTGKSGPETDGSCNCCELASISLKELEDLAPALTGHQRIYESYGMFEKPLITIG